MHARLGWRVSRLRIRVAVALTLLAAGLGPPGCRRAAPTGHASSDGQATVRIGYFANLAHAQAVLGVASGDMSRAVAPAALSTTIFNAGPSLIEALFAEEIDVGYVGPTPVLNAHARSKGQGIRVIAGASANGVAIVARKGSGIERLSDLRGRLIATPQLGNTQDASARHYLIRELGQPDADNAIAVPNAEQLAMMQRGRIDAAWSPEPWASRLILEAGGVLLAEEKDLWPGGEFVLALVVCTPRFLSDHPDQVRKILQVHRKWTLRLAEAPQALGADIAGAIKGLTGKSISAPVISQALQRTRFTVDPLEPSLRTFAAWAFELNFVRDPPDLAGLVDTAILRSLPE